MISRRIFSLATTQKASRISNYLSNCLISMTRQNSCHSTSRCDVPDDIRSTKDDYAMMMTIMMTMTIMIMLTMVGRGMMTIMTIMMMMTMIMMTTKWKSALQQTVFLPGLMSRSNHICVCITAVKPLEYQVEYRALEQSLNITM